MDHFLMTIFGNIRNWIFFPSTTGPDIFAFTTFDVLRIVGSEAFVAIEEFSKTAG